MLTERAAIMRIWPASGLVVEKGGCGVVFSRPCALKDRQGNEFLAASLRIPLCKSRSVGASGGSLARGREGGWVPSRSEG